MARGFGGLVMLLVPAAAAAQVLVPYQATQAANSASCPAHQCVLTFPKVPAGQRLVVTAISAQLGALPGPVSLEGSTATYFVPKADAAAQELSTTLTFYYGPNTTPTARIFAPPGKAATSLLVTLVGNLVPAQ